MPDHEDRAILLRQHLQIANVSRLELLTSDAHRRHLTFHDLRATGITWCAVRGDDPLRIKRRAGHKSFSTTERYIREGENLREGFGMPFPELPEELAGISVRGPPDRAAAAEFPLDPSGATGDRTPDLRIANAALSQLSYCPGPSLRRAHEAGERPSNGRRKIRLGSPKSSRSRRRPERNKASLAPAGERDPGAPRHLGASAPRRTLVEARGGAGRPRTGGARSTGAPGCARLKASRCCQGVTARGPRSLRRASGSIGPSRRWRRRAAA